LHLPGKETVVRFGAGISRVAGMNGSSGIYRKTTRQVSCKINDEVAILDLDRAIYFGLQGVGVHIWDALEQPKSVADLCSSVMAEFDVSESVCKADIEKILASLEAEGLVEATLQEDRR
jgi:hypothetical protein